MSPGNLILCLIKQIEAESISYVYLRNHENLPDDVGNDVDLLIQKGLTTKVLEIITTEAPKHGWKVLRKVQFSPLSVFLAETHGEAFLHIDLFERLEWHFIEYAVASQLLARRQWNGCVHIPYPADELYLNISTRLIYQGKVREKHRLQAQLLVDQDRQKEIRDSFVYHIGSKVGMDMANAMIDGDWERVEASANTLRRAAIKRNALRTPFAAGKGLFSYLRRASGRLISPPGPFVIFVGVAGVGKSTLIEGVLPLFKELTGRSDTLIFRGEPTEATLQITGESDNRASIPNTNDPRSAIVSIFFLIYRLIRLWIGYLRQILPSRIKNRAVIGECYAYEWFLDPHRLGLQLPQWTLRLAAIMSPKPDLVICMISAPNQIILRGKGLSESTIDIYQTRLRNLVNKHKYCVELDSGSCADIVLNKAIKLIVSGISE